SPPPQDTQAPSAPSNLGVTSLTATSVSLGWTASVDNVGVTGHRILRGGTEVGGSSVTSFADAGVSSGTTYTYTVKASDAAGNLSLPSNSVSATTSANVPSPWLDQDIGSVGLAGSASYSSGTFSVKGSGTDISSTADAFHYVFQPLSGDTQLIARVASQQNTNAWAKAGVMIRETLTPGSKHAMMVITPGNGAAFQRRVSTGGTSTSTSGGTAIAPYWVKIVRSGSNLSGHKSNDGVNWVLVGSDTITMGSTVYIGLAVTSHNNSVLNASTFDNVGTPSPSPQDTEAP